VRALVDRGHDVTVLAEDSTEADVRATGATFRPWVQGLNRPDRRPEHDPYRDWEVTNPLQLFARLVDTQFVGPAPGYLADVQAAIAAQRPDAVLCSQFAFGAMIGAEAAGVPFAVLMPNVYLLPCAGLPPLGLGFQPAHGPVGRLRDRLVGGLSRRTFDRRGLDRLNALRAEHGLAPLATFWDQVHRAQRELVMTSPDFDFPGTLPDGAVYVGPVLDDPAWAQPWAPPPGEGPLVLVALSSTFQDQVAVLQRVVDALATLPVRGLVTTGPALSPADLRAAPNVAVVASAPHSQVLAHAAAVVTHGGHGTVVKALAAGVPLVVAPHGRDQADNAARVTARGAGVAVKRTATPAALAAAVRTVLDGPGYRAGAERLGAAIRRDAASGALVRELEAVASCPAPAG
jgi:MGT family glycosyltransferase